MTTTADTGEDPQAVAVTREWMAHLGFTAEQITEAEADRDHSQCESTPEGWNCTDENYDSRHPIHDEMDQAAELVMFALERVQVTRCG